MLPEEIIKKVRLIEITTRRMVDDVMSGSYRSHFKGHGVQFSEHRPYVPGDDIRHLDWKVTARTRDPLVKKFEEERELTVFLVVDVSGSTRFSSSRKLKSEVAAEIAGMLAYAAIHTGDKVGLMLFAGEVEHIIPPKKGRQHILRIIREVIAHKPKTKGTDLARAIDGAGRIMKHSGVVFVISDFMATGHDIAMRRLARRHDVVAVRIGDEREAVVPPDGHFIFIDPETGNECFVDTGSFAFKTWLTGAARAMEASFQSGIKGGRIEHLSVKTREDYASAIVRFFKLRSRKKK
ncbi:MAG: hypothetical protein A2583_05540 [Bdellovibrionales bacterium RIFOXYD1_FULL_53_11]|nr:MAG: hypothetical protein A2583_05540 [Bdellovibrionales bacterium RIFOXYD1_FULL_53_11]